MNAEDGFRQQLLPIKREVDAQAGRHVDEMAVARELASRDRGMRDMGYGPHCEACYWGHPLECDRTPPCESK